VTSPSRGQVAPPVSAVGERGLIDRIRRRLPVPPASLIVGIGDDAAVSLPERGSLQVLTTDAMVEGVHFDRRFSSLFDVGYKSLAVNISDVAAMGATPSLALLSLMLPDATTEEDVDLLIEGLIALASPFRITIAGGNITRSPGPLIVDITLTGSVRPRRVLTRGGARPGDGLYVTGTVGAAAAGLGWLRDRAASPESTPEDPGLAECVIRYKRPEPRLRIGALLGRTRTATACMDLSDGLGDAVRQLSEMSRAGAKIDADLLPVPPAAATWFATKSPDPIRAAVAGGDDYELLFTVPPRRKRALKAVVSQAKGVSVTCIGQIVKGEGAVLVRQGRAEPLPEGFAHF
jgi:thiamine-monophosphate kinase